MRIDFAEIISSDSDDNSCKDNTALQVKFDHEVRNKNVYKVIPFMISHE